MGAMGNAKKSARLSFRTSELLRGKVDGLVDKSGQALADVCNFGLLAFWPEIEALVLANHGSLPIDPSIIAKRRVLVARVTELERLGIDIESLLDRAVELAGAPKLLPTGSQG